ncbi:MAG: serine acetyltransferase [Phycisphaeraceae bacterium]|nr:serine acetyltransferase [Phycisphaeraceae bacterium]
MTPYGPDTSMDADLSSASTRLARSIQAVELTRLRAGDGRAGRDDAAGGLRAADLARVGDLVDLLRRLMFPGFFDPEPLREDQLDAHVGQLVDRVAAVLRQEVLGLLRYPRRGGGTAPMEKPAEFAERVVLAFLNRLVHVREMLALDVQAAFDGDPAAEHTDEIILCYPGLEAIFSHRVAHELYALGVPVLPRLIAELAHSRTGIDIHPGAQIGESFFIDHGSGTVIGETSIIGRLVKIYQGVTLGARSFPKDERGRAIRGIKRHPTIGDRVNIYAGAVILGGDTVIGDDCVIAGGVFVTSSVPPGHVVQQPRADLTLRPNAAARPAATRPPRAAAAPSTPAAPPAPPVPPASAGTPARADGDAPSLSWLGDGAGI